MADSATHQHETSLDYEDRTLVVVHKQDGDPGKQVTVEGVCIKWKPGRALLLKTSKSPYGILIEAGNIVSMSVVDQTNILTQTTIKPVTVRDVRRHLLNYHGYLLSEVNTLGDESALQMHEIIHEDNPDDLGHNHDSPNK